MQLNKSKKIKTSDQNKAQQEKWQLSKKMSNISQKTKTATRNCGIFKIKAWH